MAWLAVSNSFPCSTLVIRRSPRPEKSPIYWRQTRLCWGFFFFSPALWVFFNKSGSVVVFLLTVVLALSSQKCFWCAGEHTVQGGGNSAWARGWGSWCRLCPCSPPARPPKGKRGPGVTGLEFAICLMRPLSATVLKVINCRGFSDWKGTCRPYHDVFSQLRKDVKSSDSAKSCPCTRETLEQRSVGAQALKDLSWKGPGLQTAKYTQPGRLEILIGVE